MGNRPSSADRQLGGGYLNSVILHAGKVQKRYTGLDAATRRRLEHHALLRLSRYLEVPKVAPGGDARTLLLEFADGDNGQELIRRGQSELVLRLCGMALRRLQSLDGGVMGQVLPGKGPVIVHGDFGPQNVLISLSASAATAILDWEFCHLGMPIEDLAWAEWIMRRHHREDLSSLPALFHSYGSMPHWSLRKRSMVNNLLRMRSFALANDSAADVDLWNERLDEVLGWHQEEFQQERRSHYSDR
jgi:hypothetical protein